MLDGVLNMRIKCCRMIHSVELCLYVTNFYLHVYLVYHKT